MGLERLYLLTETASDYFIALVSVLSIARRFMRRCWGQNSFALLLIQCCFYVPQTVGAGLLAEGPCRFDTVILGLNASCIKQCQFLLPKVKVKIGSRRNWRMATKAAIEITQLEAGALKTVKCPRWRQQSAPLQPV